MKIKFGFDSQFIGKYEKIIEINQNLCEEEIFALYEDEMGLFYNTKNCYYEIMEE